MESWKRKLRMGMVGGGQGAFIGWVHRMATPVIKNIQTRAVGFGPILRCCFDQCGIARIIDDHVEPDPRRKILTHGHAAVAMITAILFQVMQWSIKK